MSENTKQAWCVYEHRLGRVWTITPPIEHHAREEASYFDPEVDGPHEAMPKALAEQLRNAWAAGRMAGIELMRDQQGAAA